MRKSDLIGRLKYDLIFGSTLYRTPVDYFWPPIPWTLSHTVWSRHHIPRFNFYTWNAFHLPRNDCALCVTNYNNCFCWLGAGRHVRQLRQAAAGVRCRQLKLAHMGPASSDFHVFGVLTWPLEMAQPLRAWVECGELVQLWEILREVHWWIRRHIVEKLMKALTQNSTPVHGGGYKSKFSLRLVLQMDTKTSASAAGDNCFQIIRTNANIWSGIS